jgi:hypothetical protein
MSSNRPKRMKHPNVGSSSQPEPTPGHRRTQRSSSSNFDMDRFNAQCGNRRVIRSQTLGDDIPQLDLKELFVYQGWEPLVSCVHVTFPNLVRAFFLLLCSVKGGNDLSKPISLVDRSPSL